MPAIKTTTPIVAGCFYHVFNRAIAGQLLFRENRNYQYFMHLLGEYVLSCVDLLAYCLIPNHFHLVIRVRDDIPDLHVSNRFRTMFITYAQAINKQEKRKGGLFERPFKRLEISTDEYLVNVIRYTHLNPEKHGISSDFWNYDYSSFRHIVRKNDSLIDATSVLELFGGRGEFVDFHSDMREEEDGTNWE